MIISLVDDFTMRSTFIVLVFTKFLLTCTWPYSLLIAYLTFLITGGWRYMKMVIMTLPRDIRALFSLFRIYLCLRWRAHSVAELFSRTVKIRGREAVSLIYQSEVWTFGAMDDFSNRVANALHSEGLRQGDNIAIFMGSQPRFVGIWLGAAKIGVASGLLNTNIRQDCLLRLVSQLQPKAIVIEGSLTKAIVESGLVSYLPEEDVVLLTPLLQPSEGYTFRLLSELLAGAPTSEPNSLPVPAKSTDRLLYLFTSGTTGLPKAAIITNVRMHYSVTAINYFLRIHREDVIYNPLPLHHTVGGLLGIGACLIFGNTCVVRAKFSVKEFWPDCVQHKCTVFMYVGEICRYLLCQPWRQEEDQHCLRLGFGNGLRGDIWHEFVQRFKVKQIGEVYGATESNSNIINSENKLGAVGFSSLIFPFAYPIYLIRTDEETGAIMRSHDSGLAISCKPGEVGQMIGKIRASDPIRQFDGYVDSRESSKKVISDVFRLGDRWFLSGDLLVQDDEGYFYFVDRLGDTFRWRGENVSTTEVEQVVGGVIDFADCTVFGVSLPYQEGKAGMLALAACDTQKEADLLAELALTFAVKLPPYAQPLFVRFCPQLDTTDTFKYRKNVLAKEGFDPRQTEDHIYYLDSKANAYRRLNKDIYEEIQNNRIRF